MMTPVTKYIVLVGGAIGGAEKRFSDIFRAQIDQGYNVKMILSRVLASLLFSSEELNKYRDHLVVFEGSRWRPFLFILQFYWWLLTSSKKTDVFHYPLNPLFFLHFFPHRPFTMSLCDSTRYSMPPFKGRHDRMDYSAMKYARTVDVLSPHVYSKVSELDFIKHKVHQTPQGTFVYLPRLSPGPVSNQVVAFFGRLDNGKGLELFFDAVETLCSKDFFKKSLWEFKVYGEGRLRDFVKDKVRSLSLHGARISWEGYQPADKVLNEVQVVCSLQQETNYPSRVVAESLLFGREVLVVKTGNSNLFGELPGLHYVENSVEGFCEGIEKIDKEIGQKTFSDLKMISHAARNRFCDLKYIQYFWEL